MPTRVTKSRKSPQSHPAFPQLPHETEVWRFLDLAKLVDCMSSKHLYLTRLDRMLDKFEGSIPALSQIIEADYVAAMPPRERRFKSDVPREITFRSSVRRMLVSHAYVSCWRHGDEIEAMWRLYCGQSEGVAVRTTYGKLHASVSGRHTYLGAVRYIDYRSEFMDTSNLMTPLLYKRRGFAHEQEVRIVRQRLTSSRGEPAPGETMPWHFARVVAEVVVSPYAGQWYFDTVRAVVARFCPTLLRRVRWSSLQGDPLY